MAATKDQLFRKVSLERLSSPEQLETLIRVVTPNAWLALAPLLGLIALAAAWGWFGSIPTTVAGKWDVAVNTGQGEYFAVLTIGAGIGFGLVRESRVARVHDLGAERVAGVALPVVAGAAAGGGRTDLGRA